MVVCCTQRFVVEIDWECSWEFDVLAVEFGHAQEVLTVATGSLDVVLGHGRGLAQEEGLR